MRSTRFGGPVVPLVSMRTATPGRRASPGWLPGETVRGTPRSAAIAVVAATPSGTSSRTSSARPTSTGRSSSRRSSLVRSAPRPGLTVTTHPPACSTPSRSPTETGRLRNRMPTWSPGVPTSAAACAAVSASCPHVDHEPWNSRASAPGSMARTCVIRSESELIGGPLAGSGLIGGTVIGSGAGSGPADLRRWPPGRRDSRAGCRSAPVPWRRGTGGRATPRSP